MNVDIAASLALPIGKSSYVPTSSSNGFLAYSTALANGIHLQKVYEFEETSDNEKDEKDDGISISDGFFNKVLFFELNPLFYNNYIIYINWI